jgi:hypothetical protein
MFAGHGLFLLQNNLINTFSEILKTYNLKKYVKIQSELHKVLHCQLRGVIQLFSTKRMSRYEIIFQRLSSL